MYCFERAFLRDDVGRLCIFQADRLTTRMGHMTSGVNNPVGGCQQNAQLPKEVVT